MRFAFPPYACLGVSEWLWPRLDTAPSLDEFRPLR